MDLPVAVFEIKQYMVIFRQLEKREFNGVEAQIRGIVRCTGQDTKGDEYRLDVYFIDEKSTAPDPIVDLANKNGSLFLPFSEMYTFVDVLRNESPIFGHLRADRPEWTSVTTTNEPVGSGDEDYDGA